MRQWRVSDVMTTEVITTPEHTPVAKLVAIMSTHRVSAVPIVAESRIVGIVSQADLLAKIAATGDTRVHAPRRKREAKVTATSARDLRDVGAVCADPGSGGQSGVEHLLRSGLRRRRARELRR